MVMPTETEERVKRRALTVCQDHFRNVLDVARKVPQLVEAFIDEDKEKATRLLKDVSTLVTEVGIARRLVSQELAEIGAILSSREDFLRFANLTSEMADFSEGIGFRVVALLEHKLKVPRGIKEEMLKLSEAVLDVVIKLRQMFMALNYGSGQVMEMAKRVETAEHLVDQMYRELEIKILNSKLEIPTLLLLRDINLMLEDTADTAEDASDAVRILSFMV